MQEQWVEQVANVNMCRGISYVQRLCRLQMAAVSESAQLSAILGFETMEG